MTVLTRKDLLSLEQYAEQRTRFRAEVMAHKRQRRLTLGSHLTLLFEDRLTVQYQIQEMLRIERIFEPENIQGELDSYNPLIPDGKNWKATLMIEFSDVEQRRIALTQLHGIEHQIWAQIADSEKVFAIADEDLERSTEQKTSSVHFLRFEWTEAQVTAMREGAAISIGVTHPQYTYVNSPISDDLKAALLKDFA
jgi:hypothetical protein